MFNSFIVLLVLASKAASEITIKACSGNPCHNGGICSNLTDAFYCLCPRGFEGFLCEHNIDDCAQNPCKNGGICIDGVDEFHCECPYNRIGPFCEFEDECFKYPCAHGSCLSDSLSGDFVCSCDEGYTGELCDIDINECEENEVRCPNGGSCVNLPGGYRCDCPPRFAGPLCDQPVEKSGMARFNVTEQKEHRRCLEAGCSLKAGNGQCDAECNLLACDFDSGECSAKTAPFSSCPNASYCFGVFKDGQCNEICNTEACLFDGFDCGIQNSTCDSKEFCSSHFRNGNCDATCNNLACGFDGGDCDEQENVRTMLQGSLSLVLDMSPSEFVKRLNEILMRLSSEIRGLVLVDRDEVGAMAFVWRNGEVRERIALPSYQVSSTIRRSKRNSEPIGVKVHLVFDMSHCHGECFSDVESIADFIGTEQAQKVFIEEFGTPIREAIVQRPAQKDELQLAFWIGALVIFASLALIAGVVQLRRTRKRRVVSAATWFPPAEFEYTGKHAKLETPKIPSFDNLSALSVNQSQKTKHSEPSPLHEEASGDLPIHLPINPYLVNAKASPCGRTPLISLAANSKKNLQVQLEDARKLVEAGADVNAQDDDEETAIFVASRYQNVPLVRLLLELGADPTIMNQNDSTCLHQACHLQNLELVLELLKDIRLLREINVVDKLDRSPLAVCAMDCVGDSTIAKILIEHGADPTYPGDMSSAFHRGRTPLHYAAQYSNLTMLRFLLEHDIDKDYEDQQGCTPLFIAAEAGRLEAVKVLLAAGADPSIADQKDRTPRDVATEYGLDKIADALPLTTLTTIARPVLKPVKKRSPQTILSPASISSGSSSFSSNLQSPCSDQGYSSSPASIFREQRIFCDYRAKEVSGISYLTPSRNSIYNNVYNV